MNQYKKVDQPNHFFSKHFAPVGVKIGNKGFLKLMIAPLRSIPLPNLPIPLGNRPFIGLIFYPLGLASNLQYRVKEKWESLSVISQAKV